MRQLFYKNIYLFIKYSSASKQSKPYGELNKHTFLQIDCECVRMYVMIKWMLSFR